MYWGACGALFLFFSSVCTAAQSVRCEGLSDTSVPNTVVVASNLVSDRADLPLFCQVEGRIYERVSFVMRLPARGWNGKFAVAGCGGFCGALIPDKPGYSNSINEALKLGYAAIQTDGGHRAESWDTDWAIGDKEALALFAGAWMPLTVLAGRSLIEDYYSIAPKRTYFSGCSNGGRLGMFAAQRYPTLFDGIAAGGGIFDLTGNSGVHGLWLLQTTRDERGRAIIDRDKMPLLSELITMQCDDLDGLVDGVIARPDLCQPQVSDLQCRTEDEIDCFTAAEVTAIERLYQGATVDGEQLFAGIPPGSEFLWDKWVVGTNEDRAWGERAAEGNLRLTYGIPSDQPFNPHDYVLANELENLQEYAGVLNAVNPDLSPLTSTGNKLFYYHGLADPLILEGRARDYFDQAAATMGAQELSETARFFPVPGHGHCWEKPGQVADDFNPLEVIDRWVESGVPPEEVIASYSGTGKPRTRKLCPYPQHAHHDGGDASNARNYSCR
jgi:feruloyl esterase